MTVIDAIHGRRSIRKYKKMDISKEHLEILLRAAMAAPSARNLQPWQFVVIQDKDKLRKIKTIHPFAAMAEEAPAAILVCGDKTIEDIEGYLSLNCAAATQNILLAAHELDLATVWCAVYPREQRINDFRELCNLPDHILPVALVVVGHPDESKETKDRYKADRVHHEIW